MPIQNFSQQSRCGSQADSCQIGNSDSGNSILKHAHLIIDKSLIKFKSQIYYSEDRFETTLLVLIKQFKTLTSVEAIIVAIRGEISLLNKNYLLFKQIYSNVYNNSIKLETTNDVLENLVQYSEERLVVL